MASIYDTEVGDEKIDRIREQQRYNILLIIIFFIWGYMYFILNVNAPVSQGRRKMRLGIKLAMLRSRSGF